MNTPHALDQARFQEIQSLFQSLGIRSFFAELPEGRISWVDAAGTVVAVGRCKAILSYAGRNMSVAWAWGIPALTAAGVPTVEKDEDVPVYLENVPRRNAELFAMRAALHDGAEFYYEAPTGEESVLFLAIHGFQPVAPAPAGTV